MSVKIGLPRYRSNLPWCHGLHPLMRQPTERDDRVWRGTVGETGGGTHQQYSEEVWSRDWRGVARAGLGESRSGSSKQQQ